MVRLGNPDRTSAIGRLAMAHQPVRLRINAAQQNLSNKEQQISEFVLDNPKKASYMTISEIAAALDVAESTVFKFTRKLGYNGFRDFRNDLLTEEFDYAVSINENIARTDSPLQMTSKVFDSSIKSLSDTKSVLNANAIEEATQLILACDTLTFYGVGGSETVAADAFHKFLRAPLRVQHSTDYHIQLMEASLAGEHDTAILISHTGVDKQALQIAQLLQDRRCPIIAITSSPGSQLARMSSVALYTFAQETEYRSESLSSRIVQLSYIDALYTIVMFNDEDKARASLGRVREAIGSTRID